MITAQGAMRVVLERVPAFDGRWQEYLSFWAGEESGLCNDIGEFSDYAIDQMRNKQWHLLPDIFAAVEELMAEGDQEVRTAVATCFLDNLRTVSASGGLPLDRFIDLLGPKSRAHWDVA